MAEGKIDSRRFRAGSTAVRVAAALVVAIVAGISANAVFGAPPPQTTWSSSVDRTDVRRDEVVALRLKVTIQDSWYIYSMTTPEGGPQPLKISLVPSESFEPAAPAYQPKPDLKFDENFQVQTEQFHREAVFTVPVRIRAAATNGELKIAGEVAFQACDPKQCIPGKFPFEVTVNVVDGPAAAEHAGLKFEGLLPGTAIGVLKPKEVVAGPATSGTESSALPAGSTTGDAASVEKAKNEGLLAFLWLAITAGFLSLLTPCVFPMVPITVSYFTKHEGQSRGRGIADATVYSISIIVTFTVLGLLTSALFGATGLNSVASNPWVNVALAAIFVGLALNLFGFYEIVIPSSILTPLSKMSGSGGFIGTLLMGVTFTLTSFTCTVPLVGALLVSTSQGDWMWPLVGMLGYSAAFALPFFFLALFPGLLSSLPKAGGWMVSIKVVMGFLELAAAVKFVSNVDLVVGSRMLTRELFLSIWIAIAFVTAFYLLGKVRLPHEKQLDVVGVPRMLFSTGFLAIAFFLLTGLMGSSLGELEAFLPPISSGGSTSSARGASKELDWKKDYGQALVSAKAAGRPLFIDFTGYACTNCRWMEKNIFTVSEVREELARFERVQLYTDGQGKEYDRNRELQEQKFNSIALPLYVVIDSTTETEIARVEGLTRDPAEFVRFLKSSLEIASARKDVPPGATIVR